MRKYFNIKRPPARRLRKVYSYTFRYGWICDRTNIVTLKGGSIEPTRSPVMTEELSACLGEVQDKSNPRKEYGDSPIL